MQWKTSIYLTVVFISGRYSETKVQINGEHVNQFQLVATSKAKEGAITSYKTVYLRVTEQLIHY